MGVPGAREDGGGGRAEEGAGDAELLLRVVGGFGEGLEGLDAVVPRGHGAEFEAGFGDGEDVLELLLEGGVSGRGEDVFEGDARGDDVGDASVVVEEELECVLGREGGGVGVVEDVSIGCHKGSVRVSRGLASGL